MTQSYASYFDFLTLATYDSLSINSAVEIVKAVLTRAKIKLPAAPVFQEPALAKLEAKGKPGPATSTERHITAIHWFTEPNWPVY